MKANQLFRKTMPFAIAKLVLGAATILISVILLAILLGIGFLFGENGMVICIFIWIGATGFVRFAIMHYFGYLVKAGHVAVLAEAVTTGKIPENQVNYGKEAVKKRFATSNVYFAVDKLVSGSVKQIQRGISKLGGALDFLPGMGAVTKIANFFVELSLGYVDECCLGYTFYKKEQGAFKSACDGVVIYAQNIKHLLKNAAKTMLKVILLALVVLIAVFIPVGLIFKLLDLNAFIGFLLAVFITWVIKFAFLDSFILCQTMASYMQVAPTTQITFDLYAKLGGISRSFKELFNKGKAEEPQTVNTASQNADTQPLFANNETQTNSEQAPKPKFCGQCGAKNEANAGFCGNCGTKL